MKGLIFLLFLFPITLAAQSKTSIHFAPYSMKFWGRMPSTFNVQIQHKYVMVGYYHIRGNYQDEFLSPTKTNTIGLFFKPDLKIRDFMTFSPVIGLFNHRFPTKNAAWWAFGVNLNFKLTENLGIYYQHVSNAWLASINPGIDNIGLTFRFTTKAIKMRGESKKGRDL